MNSLKTEKSMTSLQLYTLQAELDVTKDQLSTTTHELEQSKNDAATNKQDLERIKQNLVNLRQEKNATIQRMLELHSHVYNFAASLFQTHTTVGEHRYFISYPTYSSIHEAESACRLMGGYLVEIGDLEEDKVVADLLKLANQELGANHDVYIGMTDEAEDRRWKYLHSGTDVTYRKWKSGEPSNGSTEDCVVVHYKDYNMYDRGCYFQKYRFLCEVEHK